MNLEKLYQKPFVFHRLTGLSPEKFKELARKVEPLFKEAEAKRLSRSNRKRKAGGGPKRKLSASCALFMLLLYYRTYSNHIFLGMVMGIDDNNVCRYFRVLAPLLSGIFKIPERKINMSQEEILELIIDATEQETERRKGSGYSGKRKRHTIKTQIMVNPKGTIKAVSKSVKGNVHDKKLYDSTRAYTTLRVRRKADLGYLGTSCEIPFRKSQNKALPAVQKTFNAQFATKRIVVEHTFAALKQYRILTYRFRNKLTTYNLIFKNIAGLTNFQTAQ